MTSSYNYDAIDQSGRNVSGQISSETEKEALRTLISRGLSPTSIYVKEEQVKKQNLHVGPRI